MNKAANNKSEKGCWAEFLARWYLRLHGYHILYKNYVIGKLRHVGVGEVDIIACRGKMLVFAEVKSRRNLKKAAYAITPRQRQRLTRAALAFLQKHSQYAGYQVRFDAVLIGRTFFIKHIPDAWRP